MPESLKGKWFWSEECKNAKEAVLKEMKKDVLLHRTDESGILYIYVDYAEKNGAISAFLAQKEVCLKFLYHMHLES